MKTTTLERLGLTQSEAAIYLVVIKHGSATAVTLAKEVGLPKTTVYDQLSRLVARSLVHVFIKRGRKHYAASDPQIFMEQQEDRNKLLIDYLPELKALYLENKIDRPRVRYYDTKDGIETVLRELIAEERRELLVLGSIHKEYELFASNKRIEKVISERIKKRFRARHIVDDSSQAREVQALDHEELRTTKIIEPAEPFTSIQYIWTNKVVIISATEPVTITIIDDHEAYKLQKNLFESLWRYHPELPGTKKIRI